MDIRRERTMKPERTLALAAGIDAVPVLDCFVGDPPASPVRGVKTAFLAWIGRLAMAGARAASVGTLREASLRGLPVEALGVAVPVLVVHDGVSDRSAAGTCVLPDRDAIDVAAAALLLSGATRDRVAAAGGPPAAPHQDDDRVLATVLFTDIVESTQRVDEMGDRAWLDVLDRHDEIVRREVARVGGRVVKETGDGVLATFDRPMRAIRCATAIRENVRSLGLAVRAGLHVGELEVRDDDVRGIAVHIAARILEQARPGEVLVSRTLNDLVAGTSVGFFDRGEYELHGVSRKWRLYAVA